MNNDQSGLFTNKESLVYDARNLTVGKQNYLVDTESKRINGIDYVRLNRQNEMLNPRIGLFPDGYTPSVGHVVLDVACGPGGWVCDCATAYPGVRFIGIDNNKLAIAHARQNEATKKNPNVSFELADITERFHCPDDTFDFIYLRFLVGVLPKDGWGALMSECFRILRPGGCIRMVEAEAAITVTSDDSKIAQVSRLMMEILWTHGKSFARDAMAITPMLPMFLRKAQFQNIQIQPFLIDWSYGQPMHPNVLEDFVVAIQELHNVFLAHVTEERYQGLLQGYIAEANLPSHCSFWPMMSAHGFKPL